MTLIDEQSRGCASHRSCVILIALGTAVAAVARFRGLSFRDFWFDESCTFIYVQNLFQWNTERSLLVESTNLPYYVLLRAWTLLFGTSEAGFRSLSAVAGTLTVPLLAMIAWRTVGAYAGVIVAWLAAVHPLHVHYSHEARANALWVLLLTVAMLALVEAVQSARSRWWWLFGATVLIALLTHYYTLFWIPASLAMVIFASDRQRAVRRWVITMIGVAMLFAPYLLLAVLPAAGGGGNRWIASSFDPFSAIPRTLWAMLPCGDYPGHLRGLSVVSPDTVIIEPAWLTLVSMLLPGCIFVGLAIGPIRRSILVDCADRRHLFTFGLLALVPLVGALLYSILVRPIYLVGRYDMVAWPGFLCLLGALLNSECHLMAPSAIQPRDIEHVALRTGETRVKSMSRPGGFACVLVVLLFSCSLVPLYRMDSLRPGPTLHRVRAEWLASHARESDLIVTLSYDRSAMLYYHHRAGGKAVMVSFPSWLDEQVGWVDTEADVAAQRQPAVRSDAEKLVARIEKALSVGRCFVLRDSMDVMALVLARAPVNDRQILVDVLTGALESRSMKVVGVDPDLHIFEVQRSQSPLSP